MDVELIGKLIPIATGILINAVHRANCHAASVDTVPAQPGDDVGHRLPPSLGPTSSQECEEPSPTPRVPPLLSYSLEKVNCGYSPTEEENDGRQSCLLRRD